MAAGLPATLPDIPGAVMIADRGVSSHDVYAVKPAKQSTFSTKMMIERIPPCVLIAQRIFIRARWSEKQINPNLSSGKALHPASR
jgi:hypothetical protein